MRRINISTRNTPKAITRKPPYTRYPQGYNAQCPYYDTQYQNYYAQYPDDNDPYYSYNYPAYDPYYYPYANS